MTNSITLLRPPLDEATIRNLKAGDEVLITGSVYAARDAAHKRFIAVLDRGEPLPFDIAGAIIYYVGPTPGTPDQIVGSAGPTTASRMDRYAPRLFELGLRATMGKGHRAPEITEALQRCRAVHLAATGGAGALLAKRIVKSEIVAYEDLGTEALRRMEVVDFPAIVAIDSHGRSLYTR
jgi:fumarate hydratase subunit beta